jgi:hypothetical protein
MLMHWVVKTKNPSSRLGRSSPDIYMRPYAFANWSLMTTRIARLSSCVAHVNRGVRHCS